METIEKTINGYEIEGIEGTIAAITENPEIAKFQFRATNEWISGAHNRSTIKDLYGASQEDTSREKPFVLDTDMPGVLLGTNKAANPAEILLHSLLGCMTTTMILNSSAKGLKIDAVNSKVAADIDLQGTLGLDENVPEEFSQLIIRFNIEGDLSENEKQEMIEMAKKSPLYNALINPVPIAVSVNA